ncbi:RHS repeat domain-containing protein [Chitinimonas naiadis]
MGWRCQRPRFSYGNRDLPTLYHYDAAGHLVAETDNEGHTRKEYIYLADTPVAVIDADLSVRYIHSDHLGTPRLLTNASQKAVWAWQGEPFGADQANEDPESTGTKYSFKLRFPGQYYDVETGNHYNLNRDYDPKVGRYVQSDPIGLAGGVNTYGYVGGNPLSYIDSQGLAGRGPNHSQSLRNNPDDWFGENGWDGWRSKYNGDGSHDRKMAERCNELRKWMKDICITDPVVKAKAEAAKQWCDNNFPGGTATAPITSVPPVNNKSDTAKDVLELGAAYWIISEGLRVLFPPRNLIPIP